MLNDNKIQLVDDEFFTLVYLKHKAWASYIYLNKRNNRLYNIINNDHGSFLIKNNMLYIQWDLWPQEIFTKKTISDTIFYYEII